MGIIQKIRDHKAELGLSLIIISSIILTPIANITGNKFISIIYIILLCLGVILLILEDKENSGN